MQRYNDCPAILRDFLVYHETIKGQSPLTISEYYLDLRLFLRFIKLMRNDMPMNTDLETIDIKDVDLQFIRDIDTSDIFDFLSYLANDRPLNPDAPMTDHGISASARARKLSAIKSFYKYLTVRTKQLSENPVADLEYPKLRKSLPKYLTLEQSAALLQAVSGPNEKRDYAILMLFLNCGIRRSELVGLNLTDVWLAKATKNASSTLELPVEKQSMDTWQNVAQRCCRTIGRCLAPGTETASVSPPFTGWSKKPCCKRGWIPPSFRHTSCAIPLPP